MDDVTVQTDGTMVDINDGQVSADVSDGVMVDINDGQVTADVSDDGYYYDDGSVSVDTNYSMDDDFATNDYYTGTGISTHDANPATIAAVAGFGLMAFLLWLIVIIVMIASLWKIFAKAGQPGWASIIPIYNIVVWLQIIQKPLWWIVLLFIPFVNIIIIFMMYHGLSRAFGKGVGYTLGMFFLGIIFFPMLAFGAATYLYAAQQTTPEPVMS